MKKFLDILMGMGAAICTVLSLLACIFPMFGKHNEGLVSIMFLMLIGVFGFIAYALLEPYYKSLQK